MGRNRYLMQPKCLYYSASTVVNRLRAGEGAKQELVYHSNCRTRQDLIQVIAEYIEVFTIRKRQRAKPGFSVSCGLFIKINYAGQLAA
jgi:hypothetical protein